MKRRRSSRWLCVCGRPVVEIRLDYPEEAIAFYKLDVGEGLICPDCRVRLSAERLVGPKPPDLRPSRMEQLEREAVCSCGNQQVWRLLLQYPPDIAVEIDVELWPLACPKCYKPIVGGQPDPAHPEYAWLVQRMLTHPSRGAPWRPGRIIPPKQPTMN